MRGLTATAILAAMACAASPAAALPATEVFAKASPAVWLVQADHASPGSGMMGSAVEIGPRSLVTACHVVAGATSVHISHDKGKTTIPVAQVTPDPDRSRDLCLLSVTEDLPFPPAVIALAKNVQVGTKVYAIGAPLGLELSLTDGLVSALRAQPHETLKLIQVSATTAPGSSGGGLFDDQGRLIGLTVAIASPNSENLTFALPAQWTLEVTRRVDAARRVWRARLAAHGVPMGPNGDAAPSGYAELSDLTKLPPDVQPAKGVADAYRQFLLLAKPRAFVLTSDGHFGTVSDTAALDALFKDCAAKKINCKLYAADDAVVWRP